MTSREVYQRWPIRHGKKREPGSFWQLGDTELAILYQGTSQAVTAGTDHGLGEV
jgi:hypothetical protein